MTDVSIYLATRMTGRTGKEVWDEYFAAAPIYERAGIKVLSPLFGENIPHTSERLPDRPDAEGVKVWFSKDKPLIEAAHVCVFPGISQGIMREYSFSRGVLWKPTVFIGNGGFIAREEDDKVCTSHQEAALTIVARWGTRPKRFRWRLNMLNKSLPKWIWRQIREFK